MERNMENMIEWLTGDDTLTFTVTDSRMMTKMKHAGIKPIVENPDGSKMYKMPF